MDKNIFSAENFFSPKDKYFPVYAWFLIFSIEFSYVDVLDMSLPRGDYANCCILCCE